MWTTFIFSLALGVSVYSLLELIVSPLSGVSQQKVRRVKTLGNEQTWSDLVRGDSPVLVRLLGPYLVPGIAALIARADVRVVQLRLERSGVSWTVTTYYVYKTVLFLLALSLGLLSLSQNTSPRNLVTWALICVVSYHLPDVQLRAKTLLIKEQILREFPDFIDTVRIYLSTGMSIYQAMKYIAEISGPGLKPYLERLSADLEIYSQLEALHAFAQRVNLVEVDNFVVAMEQALQSGMSLKELFLSQSTMLREMRRMTLTKKIKQKPVYLALVGGLLFLNIFIIIGLPAMVTLFAMKGL